MKNLKNLSKRGLSLFLALVMCLGMVQITAFAEESHTHNEGGWTCTQAESTRELVCDKHVHGEGCYETERGELTCEAEEHQHGDGCYEAAEPVLDCGEAEHTHGDSCYDEEGALACEQAEHSHSDSCYTEGKAVLTCGKPEHTHGDGCYATETVKVCAEEDHQHGDECYTVTEGEWTCTEPSGETGDGETEDKDGAIQLTWDEETLTMTISGTGELGWTSVDWPKNWNATKVLKVEGVELVNTVFSQFTALEDVTLDDVTIADSVYPFYKAGSNDGMTVTVNGGTLGKNAFWGCSALTGLVLNEVDIADGTYPFYQVGSENGMSVTMNGGSLGNYAFQESNVSSVKLCEVDTVSQYAFLKCAKLNKVTFDGVKTVGAHAFDSCVNLSSVNLNAVDSIEDYAFAKCALTEVNLDQVTHIGGGAFSFNDSLVSVKLSNVDSMGRDIVYACGKLETVEIYDCESVGYRAFRNCPALTTVTIENVDTVGWLAFESCKALSKVTLTKVGQIEGGAFQGCNNLETIDVAAETQLGYVNSGTPLTEVITGISDRVEAILKGQFALDKAPEIVELTPDTGWDDSKTGKSENWNAYDNGTQIVEQARWTNSSKTEAEVKVDAYYTAEKQMDYIFVVDLSNSMTLLGNPSDMNARFYDMQSKLLDVSEKLLSSPGYDCRVAFVTFGLNTSETFGFYSDAASARAAINSLIPYYENTNYGRGLRDAKALVKAQDVGRETTVVFISDGQPRDGKDNSIFDLNGAVAAAEIKELGASIYGVLQSVPADEYDGAVAAMKNVCSDRLFFKSSDTQSFSDAVNAAIAAPYADYTVTIPVNPDFENVRGLEISASAGEARYDANSHTITWTVTGMPFTKHTLTYNMSLTSENAGRYGDQSYPANSGNAVMKDGASVETPVLTRSVSRPTTPGTNYYTLTVNYVYEDGSEAASTVVQTRLTRGNSYNVTSPELEGYTPDQAVVSGTMPGRNVVVTVTYTANTVNLPDENPPLIDEPGTDDPTDNPPVVDLPDENPPLVEIPEVDPPLVDIPEEDPPLVDIPEEDPPLVDIPENDPPLVDVPGDEPKLDGTPKTGDSSRTALWAGLCAVSLTGIAVLMGKKKEDEEA